MGSNASARRIAAPALAVLAAIALLAALVVGYSSRAFFDADQFSARASSALEDDAVAAEIGRRVAADLIATEPDLVGVGPVIEQVVAGVVGSAPFADLFRSAIRDVHRTLFEQDRDSFTLTVADIGATVRGALQAINPRLARSIPAGAAADVLESDPPPALVDLAQVADEIKPLPWILLAAGVLLAGAALWVSPDRRTTALTCGIAIVIGAVVALVGLQAVRAFVLTQVEDGGARDAATALWQAFLGDLRTALLLFAACGAVVAAAATSLLRPVDIGAPLRRAWELVSELPESRRGRALRAALLLAVGILIVVRHRDFLDLLAILAGLYLAYAGASELMRLTIPAEAGAEAGAPRGRGVLVAAGVSAVAIVGAGALFIGVGGATAESVEIETEGCNGSEELCERTLDEVAFAATHNAMSAATNPGWLFAQQEAGFADQLHEGVRAFLIDAHYGVETKGGTVKTDLSSLTSGERQTYEDELGPQALDAALRIRDRLVGSAAAGERGVYLCHRFCELGAIPIDRAFADFRDFLAANPDEVLVITVEDYVEPEDIEAAVERTGLIDHVWTGPLDPLPTLAEMIESGGRAVIVAENDAGAGRIPWYHEGYDELVQETPYSYANPGELIGADAVRASCAENRGPASAPLFLINHWVDTSPAPRPSNARRVNAREALLDRIHECERLRRVASNLIAVDFYREGELFDVVAALNAERGD